MITSIQAEVTLIVRTNDLTKEQAIAIQSLMRRNIAKGTPLCYFDMELGDFGQFPAMIMLDHGPITVETK